MAHTYMVDTVGHFFDQLDSMGRTLHVFSDDVKGKQAQIVAALDDFQKETGSLKARYLVKGKNCNHVEEATNQAIEVIDREIEAWSQQRLKNAKGTEFMNRHQEYLVVMIFGAVKSGKSSLGNFMAGKSFLDAPFDNEFKRHPAVPMESEESGRAEGGIEKDEKGRQFFKVGFIDTTGAIQYFTMSGLRWMDSPGTGAISKEGDQVDMEKLVDEYIPYTDFCLFLQNSSEPGLQSDMKYIRKLTHLGQEALIIITKSDETDWDETENGKLVQTTVPKAPERRKLQEDDVLKRFGETYPDVDRHSYDIFSISTNLAGEAVKEDNDDKFKASHLDLLMKRLGDTFANKAGQLKQERVRKTVNVFVDQLLAGEDGDAGLSQVQTSLDAIRKEQETYVHTLQQRKKRMCASILSKIKHAIRAQAEEWDAQANKGKSIQAEEAERAVSSIIEKYVSEEINKEVVEIIDHFSGTQLGHFQANLNVGGISKQTKTIEQEYKKKVVRERSARGLWENFRSFLGKTYYETTYETVKKQIHVDVGTNMEDYMERLEPVVSKAVTGFVSEALGQIEKTYFAPQEQYAKKMEAAMKQLRQKLESVKFKETN